jgi:site-specific recombinase XerD
MLDQVLANRDTVQELGITGSYLDSFAAHLAGCGYAATTVRSQLKLLGHFNEWLIRRRCDIHQLNDELVDTFVNSRKRRGRLHRGDATTVHQFLTPLRARGELEASVPVVDQSPLGQLQRDYEHYLTTQRGLAPVTVSNYADVLRWFLTDRFGNGPLELGTLNVSTITTFVIRQAHTMSPRYAQGMVTALRSICRFLRQRGAIDRDLAAGVPSVSDWRLVTIPKYLHPEEIEACFRRVIARRRSAGAITPFCCCSLVSGCGPARSSP